MALHITTTIQDNALAAVTACDRIKLQVARILNRERTALVTQTERVEVGVRSTTQQADDDHRKFMTVIRTATHYQLREAGKSLRAGYTRVVDQAGQTLCGAELKLKQSMETIAHRSQIQLGDKTAAVEKAVNSVALQATAKVQAAGSDLDNRQAQIAREAGRRVATASDDLIKFLASIASLAVSTARPAKDGIETFVKVVVGLGPQATLRRGFTIVWDAADRPVPKPRSRPRRGRRRVAGPRNSG